MSLLSDGREERVGKEQQEALTDDVTGVEEVV